jgi:type IX secretion system PorP/SprF family membrane protein
VNGSRLAFNYRDQWAKIAGVFRTYSAGYDLNVPKVHSGFGILMTRDEAGAGNLGRSDLGAFYSWYGLINKTAQLYFRPGVEFKLAQRSIDFQRLIFGDQITPSGVSPSTTQPFPQEPKKTYVDAAASFMLYNPDFWAGVGVDHLFRPVDGFYDPNYRVPLKYSVFAGYKFKMGQRGRHYGRSSSGRIENWFFVSTYLRMQSASAQMDLGGYWNHLPFTLGIWIRGIPYLNIVKSPNIDAVIFLVGYRIYNFDVGYSYDMTVSPLLAKTGGAHEISIIYRFSASLKSRKREGPIPCPNL